MVEIEIGVLRGQCLDRRIDESKRLVSEIAAWERQRNAAAARIKWMFTTAKARAKMGRAYPDKFKESTESLCRGTSRPRLAALMEKCQLETIVSDAGRGLRWTHCAGRDYLHALRP